MADYNSDRIGRLVLFLTDVKSEMLINGRDGKMIGGCGNIAAAMLFDKCINRLITQQTQIENLDSLLKIEKEENEEYHRVFGELEDCTLADGGYEGGYKARDREIIRCEDCKCWSKDASDITTHGLCTEMTVLTSPKFYCASGKAKT